MGCKIIFGRCLKSCNVQIVSIYPLDFKKYEASPGPDKFKKFRVLSKPLTV